MGNQLAVGGSLQELHLQDLGEGLAQDRTLGGGRLLKSVQCWTQEGMPVVVKVYLKKEDDPSLGPYHEKLRRFCEQFNLKDHPNVLGYDRMVETDKAGYLMRQYCNSNLADRISSRPFFSRIGKRWIAYQILQGLHQIHHGTRNTANTLSDESRSRSRFYHGDIKSENIVLTSWDWVMLTDLAPFKPFALPSDDPGKFSYFFDTSEKRISLLAPERFYSSSGRAAGSTVGQQQQQVDESGRTLSLRSNASMAASPHRYNTIVGSSSSGSVSSDGIYRRDRTGSTPLSRGSPMSGGSPSPPAQSFGTISDNSSSSNSKLATAAPVEHGNAAMSDEVELYNINGLIVTVAPSNTNNTIEQQREIVRQLKEQVAQLETDQPASPTQLQDATVTAASWALESQDIFSVGCVLAQLFLDGEPLFDLSQLLQYRKLDTTSADCGPMSDNHVRSCLRRIDDVQVRHMIMDMIQLNPTNRIPTARAIIEKYTPSIFPPFFHLLHEGILSDMILKDCNERIDILQRIYDPLMEILATHEDEHYNCDNALEEMLRKLYRGSGDETDQGDEQRESGTSPLTTPDGDVKSDTEVKQRNEQQPSHEGGGVVVKRMSKLHDTTTWSSNNKELSAEAKDRIQKAVEIISGLVCSSMRNAQSAELRVKGLALVEKLSEHSTDYNRLQRLVPYTCMMLGDSTPLVKIAAVKTLTTILSRVQKFPPSEINLFNDYLLPALRSLTVPPAENEASMPVRSVGKGSSGRDGMNQSEQQRGSGGSGGIMGNTEMVRSAVAEYLPLLASEARRFLELAQLMKHHHQQSQHASRNKPSRGQVALESSASDSTLDAEDEVEDEDEKMLNEDTHGAGNVSIMESSMIGTAGTASGTSGSSTMMASTYDKDLAVLQDEFSSLVLALSMDESSNVKRALLKNVIHLCTFYGRRKASDFVLPMMITFLNVQDWRLRQSFFEQIVAVSVFVGPFSLKEFILPCIVQGLYDSEEHVVQQALNCLVSLCELGMFDHATMVADLALKIAPLLHHPNTWLRYNAVAFFGAMSKRLGSSDTSCYLVDLLQPHLRHSIYGMSISEYNLLEAQKSPLSRNVYDAVLQYFCNNFDQIGAYQRIHEANDHEQQQSSDSDNLVKFWEERLDISNIRRTDAEHIVLMLPYIEQYAKVLKSKMWDIADDTSASQSAGLDGSVIHLSRNSSGDGGEEDDDYPKIPLNTVYIAADNNSSTDTASVGVRDFSRTPSMTLAQIAELQTGSSPTLSGSPPAKGQQQLSGTSPGVKAPIKGGSSYTTVNKLSSRAINEFRPKGNLFAESFEHSGSVNEVAVHESHRWFITGSSDSTVKLWDLRQFDDGISAMSSRNSYRIPSSSVLRSGRANVTGDDDSPGSGVVNDHVLSVAIQQGPGTQSSIIAASTNHGFIHTIDLETNAMLNHALITEEGRAIFCGYSSSGSSARSASSVPSSAINVVRSYNCSTGAPIFICGNRNGHLVAIDGRAGGSGAREAFSVRNDFQGGSGVGFARHSYHMGPITAMCGGGGSGSGDCTWIVTGTRRGFLTLWDMRFQIPVMTWRITPLEGPMSGSSVSTSINYIDVVPNTNLSERGPALYISTNSHDVVIWDMEKQRVTERYVLCDNTSERRRQRTGASKQGGVDENPFAVDELGQVKSKLEDQQQQERNIAAQLSSKPVSSTMMAMSMSLESVLARSNFETKGLCVNSDGNFFVGATDKRIRFFDRSNTTQNSYVVSGLEPFESLSYKQQECDEYPDGMPMVGSEIVVREHITTDEDKKKALRPRGGVFNMPLSTSHRDTVTDVKIAGTQIPMLVSAARDGAVRLMI